ncbi:MAG: tRNA 2-thiouridine synthesizing protein [Actinomycetota bacterium]|nr:tRNA 2-thiouridine synthesizing protein [Actinomycetota bacterium]
MDARGLRCPLPVIRLGEAARDALAGTVIVVLATDPAARHDIPAWCRMRDHELRELAEVGDDPAYLRFVVVVPQTPPQRSKADGSGSGSERSSRATLSQRGMSVTPRLARCGVAH